MMEKVFLNSLPKSGTNLVSKFLDLLKYNHIQPGIAATLLLGKFYFLRYLIIRDPRDVLISYAHYVAKTPSHFIYPFYKNLSFEERIRFTLEGGRADNLYIESFPQILKNVEGWFNKENVMIVKFEELIGEKGGGSKDIQLNTIRNICKFLNIKDVDYEKISNNLFGGTHTFRKGKIGSWKEELSNELKILVKEKIGDIIKRWGYN